MDNDVQVLVSQKELSELERDQEILHALYAAGVDNWDFYDEALESLRN